LRWPRAPGAAGLAALLKERDKMRDKRAAALSTTSSSLEAEIIREGRALYLPHHRRNMLAQ
jgi:hypothetical protein